MFDLFRRPLHSLEDYFQIFSVIVDFHFVVSVLSSLPMDWQSKAPARPLASGSQGIDLAHAFQHRGFRSSVT